MSQHPFHERLPAMLLRVADPGRSARLREEFRQAIESLDVHALSLLLPILGDIGARDESDADACRMQAAAVTSGTMKLSDWCALRDAIDRPEGQGGARDDDQRLNVLSFVDRFIRGHEGGLPAGAKRALQAMVENDQAGPWTYPQEDVLSASVTLSTDGHHRVSFAMRPKSRMEYAFSG